MGCPDRETSIWLLLYLLITVPASAHPGTKYLNRSSSSFIEMADGSVDEPVFIGKAQGISALFRRGEVQLTHVGVRLSLRFEGGSKLAVPKGFGPTASRYTFLSASATLQPRAYEGVEYREIYDGITVRFTNNLGHLKSDYEICADADPDKIRFRYEGTQEQYIDETGSLVLSTEVGAIREQAPIAFQEFADGRKSVSTAYQMYPDGTVGFKIGAYDHSRSLTIDPYVLAYSWVNGGSTIDAVTSMAVDSAGFVYLAGYTDSLDFPTVGSGRSRQPGVEAFVLKLSPVANQIVYATYLGGSGDDRAMGLAVDGTGSVYVVGSTTSLDFPTVAAAQAQISGGRDGFVARLNPQGNALVFSTYLGGQGSDLINAACLTRAGELWVAGESDSIDFPVRSAFQTSRSGGEDAVLAKFTPAGALVYATYLGGSGNDRATGVAADDLGNAYLTGGTDSTNFPTSNPLQPANGGHQDAFVAGINAAGNSLLFSTYLGGSGGTPGHSETGNGIALDGSGAIVVVGTTSSTDFPLASPIQGRYGGGGSDAFIARLAPGGLRLIYSSYFGGASTDDGLAVISMPDGSVYFAGDTASPDLPDINAIQTSNAGLFDGFIAKLAPDNSALMLSSYMGGSLSDSATALGADAAGNIYIAGTTFSSDFLPGPGHKGSEDIFLLMLNLPSSVTVDSSPQGLSFTVAGSSCNPGSYASPVVFTWPANSSCAVSFSGSYLGAGSARYQFSSWQDAVTSNTRVVTTTSGGTYSFRANFQAQFPLTTLVLPPGAGLASAAPGTSDGYYNQGAIATLTASPAAGYQFLNWSGSLTGSTNPQGLAISAASSAVANFACVYSVGGSISAPAGASQQSIGVSTGSGCAWTAASGASWITILVSPPVTGSGSVIFRVDANPLMTSRSGTITVAGQTVTVVQAASVPACLYSFSPPSTSVASTGVNNAAFLLTTAPNCSWTVAFDRTFVKEQIVAGTGNSTISYNVYPNFSTLPRNANIIVSGSNYAITQGGATGTSDQRFVQLLYFNFFGRLPAPSEVQFQITNGLNAGLSRADLAVNFFNSAEFNGGGRFIAGLYVGILGRDAEYVGWLFQRNALAIGIVNQQALVTNFINSAEFAQKNGNLTDGQFVTLMYQQMLLRTPSQSEVDFQVSQSIRPSGRIQFAINLLNSQEFLQGTGPRLTAFLLYACLLQRDTSLAELNSRATQIAGGMPVKSLISDFVNSPEFNALLQ